MKKFAAVALAVTALTLSACTPATSTPVAAPSPSQAAPSPSQAPISVPAETPAPVVPAPAVTTAPAPVEEAPASCEEDEPCWDCATMGNMICGPVEAPAQPVQAVQPIQPVQPVKSAPVVPAQPVQPSKTQYTAEDGSKVGADFYSNGPSCNWVNGLCQPATASKTTANTVPASPKDLKLGDAWAGTGAHYGTTTQPQPKEGKVSGQSCTLTGC